MLWAGETQRWMVHCRLFVWRWSPAQGCHRFLITRRVQFKCLINCSGSLRPHSEGERGGGKKEEGNKKTAGQGHRKRQRTCLGLVRFPTASLVSSRWRLVDTNLRRWFFSDVMQRFKYVCHVGELKSAQRNIWIRGEGHNIESCRKSMLKGPVCKI